MASTLNLVGYLVNYDEKSKTLVFKYSDFKKESAIVGISNHEPSAGTSETKDKLERMDASMQPSEDIEVHYSCPIWRSGFKIKLGNTPLAMVNKYMLNDVFINARINSFSFTNFNEGGGVQKNTRVVGWNLTLISIDFCRSL